MKTSLLIACLSASLTASCTDESGDVDVTDEEPTDGGKADGAESGQSAFANSNIDPVLANKAKTLRLDVNDVSILFPLVEESQFLSRPAIESLLPSKAYRAQLRGFLSNVPSDKIPQLNPLTGLTEVAGAPSDTLPDALPDLANFRTVSMRIDDCALGSSDGAATASVPHLSVATTNGVTVSPTASVLKCFPQMRLVLQDPSNDVAVHLIFTYFKNQAAYDGSLFNPALEPNTMLFAQMMEDLKILKAHSLISTDGQPLTVHPGFRSGSQSARFVALVDQFIKHYTSRRFLTNLAFLSTSLADDGIIWAMAGSTFTSAKPDSLKLSPVLAVKGTPLSQGFQSDTQFEPSFPGSLVVKQERPPNGEDSTDFTFDVQSVANLPKVFNPKHSNPANVDCVSCHAATRVLSNLLFSTEPINAANRKQTEKALKAGAFFVPAPGISALALPSELAMASEQTANFHNFGFFDTRPSISLRTVFESGTVAASINRRLYGSPNGPGWSCTKSKYGGNVKASLDFSKQNDETPLKKLFAGCSYVGLNGAAEPKLLP
jgi:hypothetical protein